MDAAQYNRGIDKYAKIDPDGKRFGPNKDEPLLQEELVAEVNKVAGQIPGAEVIQPPGVKSLKRAAGKVEEKYGGDWGRIKDLNRCTLVVPAESAMKLGVDLVRAHFTVARHRSRLQYHSESAANPADTVNNPCGYSGATIFVRTAGLNTKKGEVQINYPS
jgi:hypothetical protein